MLNCKEGIIFVRRCNRFRVSRSRWSFVEKEDAGFCFPCLAAQRAQQNCVMPYGRLGNNLPLARTSGRKCRDAQPVRFRAPCIMVRDPSRQPGKRGRHCYCFAIGSRVARGKAAFIFAALQFGSLELCDHYGKTFGRKFFWSVMSTIQPVTPIAFGKKTGPSPDTIGTPAFSLFPFAPGTQDRLRLLWLRDYRSILTRTFQ